MSEPVRHHVVPKCYLEAFHNSGRKLHVLPKGSEREPFESSLNNVAVRKNYYSFNLGEGKYDARIERTLADLEGVAKPILQKIISYNMITKQQKEDLAIFIGILHTRNPNFRKGTEESLRQVMEAIKNTTIDDDKSFFEIFGDIPDKIEEVAGGKENVRSWIKENVNVVIPTEASLEHISSGITIGTILSSMRWRFWINTFEDLPYITSDNPCYVCNKVAEKSPYGAGIAVKGSRLHLPISPKVCLIADWEGHQTEFKTNTDIKRIIRINSQTIRHAESEVYSSIVNTKILNIHKKNKQYSFETLIDHIGPYIITRRKLVKKRS